MPDEDRERMPGPLRTRHDFNAVLEEAERRHNDARADFVREGGEALLGIEV